MAAGTTIKHKRKAGAFSGGHLEAGEFGVDTTSGLVYYSTDGGDILSLVPREAVAGNYLSTEFTSQTSVTVTHNFGHRPIVDVIDNTGAVIVPLSIIHASVNAFTVTFSASTTGIILSSTGDSGTDGADGDGTAYYGQLSRTTSGTVSSISAGVYKSTGLAGTLGTEVYGFERGTDQMSLKNVSGEPILCRFYASADIEAGNNKVLGIKLALDGVLIDETECRAPTGLGTTFAKLVTSWIIEVADGEEVALYVANHTTTDNLTVQRCRLIAATVGRQGEQGIQGETGDAGADALWNFTGAYSGGSAYAIGDVATYDGQTWYRINANGGNVGDTPAEGTFWTLIAAEGATGPTGATGATDLTIVTDATAAVTLDASNCYPSYIRCTSASAITLTLAAGQSAAVGRHWIIRQAGAGIATVSTNDSTPAAITLNGNASTGGQHTDITVRLVADGVLDIKDGTQLGTSPTDIAGCAVWLDFSDSSTLFDATSDGSTPAADGNIRRIEDKSGNSRHFVERTSTAAPIRKLAQINGLDVGYFTSDEMRRAESLSTSGGGALFMVVQRTFNNSGGGIHGIRGNSNANAQPSSGSYLESFGITARQSWVEKFRADVHLYSVTWDGSTFLVRINGITVFSQTSLTGANTQNPILIGGGSPGGNPGDGYYGEVVVYTSAVSSGDRDALEAALMAKWGI
jgi:hypothetical protein